MKTLSSHLTFSPHAIHAKDAEVGQSLLTLTNILIFIGIKSDFDIIIYLSLKISVAQNSTHKNFNKSQKEKKHCMQFRNLASKFWRPLRSRQVISKVNEAHVLKEELLGSEQLLGNYNSTPCDHSKIGPWMQC